MNRHALPFFLKAPVGERFCLYYPPAEALAVRGAVLYVHPFAEELNKSRRMAALQARACANAGYGVLQIDLYGCGDSSGDFADARWHIWLADLALAWQWLQRHVSAPAYLWGLRLGALLALRFAVYARPEPLGLVLWQTVLSGRVHLRQFLRLQHASTLLAGAASHNAAIDPAQSGAPIEVGGYRLTPALIDDLNHAEADLPPASAVQWLELAPPPCHTVLQPASTLLLEQWQQAGVRAHGRALAGASFWATTEIVEVPALIAATLAALPALSP